MKKKKIVIIAILIILIIIAGVIVYLYKNTDYLKTKQQLFWKYAIQNSEITNLFNSEELSEIKRQKTINSYKANSQLKITNEGDIYTIDTNTNAKNTNDIFTYVEIEKNSNSVVDFNLVKKSNVVGIKMDELANGYITLKNSNLKDLAERIGIEDLDMIPENINVGTYLDLLEISDEDTTYITNKYTNLILSDTTKDNYSKGESMGIKIDDQIHTGTAYKISLTENETKKILRDIFLELSKDSRTLNLISSKMKLLNFGSEHTSVNTISNKFLEISEKINSVESTDDEFIEVTVYVENFELLQTNIKFKNENLIKITYDKENNNLKIKQELLNKKTKFVLSISDALDKAISQIQEVDINTDVSEDKTEVTTNVDIICDNNLDISYNSTTKITNDIEMSSDYDESLKIIINDLNELQLKNLYKAILVTIPGIYQDKIVAMNNESEQSNSENMQNQTNEEETSN